MTNAATKAATHVARVPESGWPLPLRLELGKGTHSPARSRIWRNNSAERRMPPRCSSSRSGRTAGIRPSAFAISKKEREPRTFNPIAAAHRRAARSSRTTSVSSSLGTKASASTASSPRSNRKSRRESGVGGAATTWIQEADRTATAAGSSGVTSDRRVPPGRGQERAPSHRVHSTGPEGPSYRGR